MDVNCISTGEPSLHHAHIPVGSTEPQRKSIYWYSYSFDIYTTASLRVNSLLQKNFTADNQHIYKSMGKQLRYFIGLSHKIVTWKNTILKPYTFKHNLLRINCDVEV